ncbi:MAG: DegT/DnrJ/EryC1/StrS family aminotransferase [Deltaproteobacteria bacterium]|nr:DegT/DnrJ/EryC1/StrS family aminotransferase [Deltaproteobacteria bacterium]
MIVIPLARPSIGPAELEAQARALASGRLVLGPENAAFEQDVARVAGVSHAVAVANGTGALHLVLWALGLPQGGEVLVPAFTFPAPAHAACVLGLKVVPVDVDPDSWNMSPAAAARAISPRTCAMIAVDQFGLPADMAALGDLAEQAGIPLLEDSACAIGAIGAHGKPAGSFGVAGCFSFHPRKIVTTGEGGAVVTAQASIAERVRALRNHGQVEAGSFVEPGLNYRLPETSAAVGRVQLGRLQALLDERAELALLYRKRLDAGRRKTAELRTQAIPTGFRHAFQVLAVMLPGGVDRARVVRSLRERGIEAGVATFALHRIASLSGLPGLSREALPVAERLHDQAMALPFWNGMSEMDVDRVVGALEEIL